MKNVKNILFLFLAVGILFSCDPEPEDKKLEIPTDYDFTRNNKTTVSYGGQLTRIQMGTELIKEMKALKSNEVQLLEMFNNKDANGNDANPFSTDALNSSTKSIQSKIAASKDFFSTNTAESAKIKADFKKWIGAHVNEVVANKDNEAKAGHSGQIADGSKARYVDSKGREMDQLVNKSMIGALILDQIVNNYLSPTVLDGSGARDANDKGTIEDGKNYTTMEHKWDEAYGYLFATAEDGSKPLASLGSDIFLNKYLDRVNGDADFKGIAQTIFDAFKKGRAAIVAKDYKVRDEQVDILRKNLSKVVAIRTVYYLQGGKKGLANGDKGGAFHDLSEGYGFLYSLRFARNSSSTTPVFDRSTIDGFLAKLDKDNGFWSVSGATLDEISEAIASKFDFTVAQAAN